MSTPTFEEKPVLRVFEGFAGYGGGSFGLKRLKEKHPEIDYEVIGYSEFDKFASELFDANHKDKNGILICLWEVFLANLFLPPACRKARKIPTEEEPCLAISLEFAR